MINLIMLKCSRKPAIVIVLLTLVAAAMLIFDQSLLAGTGDDQELVQLQRAIADSNANADTWFRYAKKLQSMNRHQHAATAYIKVLEVEPTNRLARFNAAICLAKAQQVDEFFDFMKQMVLSDPKLAADLFERPEPQVFMTQARFQALAKEAQVQAMD